MREDKGERERRKGKEVREGKREGGERGRGRE